MGKYDVYGDEGKEQAGTDEAVLSNLLGITKSADIDTAETELLEAIYQDVFDNFPKSLSTDLIKHWHYRWLGNLYEWAGDIRTVDLSKPDIRFASLLQIPKLLDAYENSYLNRYEELSDFTDDDVVSFLAESHVEFILIHPFREGNGRISRLLLDVLAVQAGFEPLDYELWDNNKDFYFAAIQAGLQGDYQHVERLVRDVLEQQEEDE